MDVKLKINKNKERNRKTGTKWEEKGYFRKGRMKGKQGILSRQGTEDHLKNSLERDELEGESLKGRKEEREGN